MRRADAPRDVQVAHVAGNDLPSTELLEPGGVLGAASQAAHAPAMLDQGIEDGAARLARRSIEQDHAVSSREGIVLTTRIESALEDVYPPIG